MVRTAYGVARNAPTRVSDKMLTGTTSRRPSVKCRPTAVRAAWWWVSWGSHSASNTPLSRTTDLMTVPPSVRRRPRSRGSPRRTCPAGPSPGSGRSAGPGAPERAPCRPVQRGVCQHLRGKTDPATLVDLHVSLVPGGPRPVSRQRPHIQRLPRLRIRRTRQPIRTHLAPQSPRPVQTDQVSYLATGGARPPRASRATAGTPPTPRTTHPEGVQPVDRPQAHPPPAARGAMR